MSMLPPGSMKPIHDSMSVMPAWERVERAAVCTGVLYLSTPDELVPTSFKQSAALHACKHMLPKGKAVSETA